MAKALSKRLVTQYKPKLSTRTSNNSVYDIMCEDGKRRTVKHRERGKYPFIQICEDRVFITISGYINSDNIFIATGKNAHKIKKVV